MMTTKSNRDLMYKRGLVTWHTSEKDGGPDVGISIGLGSGRMLYCGEIPRDRWEASSDEVRELGSDAGWWIVIYGPETAEIVGRSPGIEGALALIDEVGKVLAP